ncbi:MAG: carboxymuconolactone decarboxylase family protein [Thermomicrobiales bacterium]|jgi:AhpD family alkylhydroperoxidase|nr:carboxymuconolactone decarboxylase family protein [Thermomicrobiales bacterium]
MNTRISDRGAMQGLYQQMLGLEEYIESTDLEPRLIHLIKMRASQINGCAYCMALHTREGLADGERVDRLAVLSAWRETDWFTPREQAALAWTEAVTTLEHGGVPEDVFIAARDAFGEKGLCDLTLVVIAINGWNRVAIPFQSAPESFSEQ